MIEAGIEHLPTVPYKERKQTRCARYGGDEIFVEWMHACLESSVKRNEPFSLQIVVSFTTKLWRMARPCADQGRMGFQSKEAERKEWAAARWSWSRERGEVRPALLVRLSSFDFLLWVRGHRSFLSWGVTRSDLRFASFLHEQVQ